MTLFQNKIILAEWKTQCIWDPKIAFFNFFSESLLLWCLLRPMGVFFIQDGVSIYIRVYHSFIEFQKQLNKSDNFYPHNITVGYKCLLWDEFELTKTTSWWIIFDCSVGTGLGQFTWMSECLLHCYEGGLSPPSKARSMSLYLPVDWDKLYKFKKLIEFLAMICIRF